MDRHFTPVELEEADWLSKKYPLATCECGEITLGGNDGTFPFAPHTHKEEA